jgi:DNA helicase-2/ATP-dependent DNA helicase PcrA
LNPEQKRVVETTEGPILVVAGPGTGKTQILALRVAEILEQTDTSPGSVLCLTYTNAGAENMRERLHRFLGPASYEVAVHTYHAFGEVILREYADYFAERNFTTMIDDLKKHELLTAIVAALPYNDPLRYNTDIGQIASVLSAMKQGNLTSERLRETAAKNLLAIASVRTVEFPTGKKYEELAPGYEALYERLNKQFYSSGDNPAQARDDVAAKNETAYLDAPLLALRQTLDEPPVTATGKISVTGLTGWRRKWFKKDKQDRWVLAGEFANQRAVSLAGVAESYAAALAAGGFYDYDDMILEAIKAVAEKDDLRFTLQERWQYLLLDEYQDTNAAQDKLVELLTNNPVAEGRPNVMAVGDDDQTVYGFQGALASRLSDFAARYRETETVVLRTNYRSEAGIVGLSQQVINHVPAGERVAGKVAAEAFSKGAAEIAQIEYPDEEQEFSALAMLAKMEWEQKRKVAVLAPKHKVLVEVAQYLAAAGVPVIYEKRENVLEIPAVRKIISLLRLAVGLSEGVSVAHLYPKALSAPWLGVKIADLMEKNYGAAAEFMAELAAAVDDETLETFLTRIINRQFKEYYLQEASAAELYQITGALNTLRRNVQNYYSRAVRARDLVQYADSCEAAGIRVAAGGTGGRDGAVALLTAHSAKGLEFDTVLIANADDATWGIKKGNNNVLTLPWNFEPVVHTGDSHGEAARVFFVAVSRAKTKLYLLRAADKMPLRFLPTVEPTRAEAAVLEKAAILELPWLQRALDEPGLEEVLREKLKDLRLSPTDLTTWLDVIYAGPEKWFEQRLLHFPSESSAAIEYGNLVHEVMAKFSSVDTKSLGQPRVNVGRRPAEIISALLDFADKWIKGRQLLPEDEKYVRERATAELPVWLEARAAALTGEAKAEIWFDGVIGEVPVQGKIDRLEIDRAARRLTVVDFKTGKPHEAWDEKDATLRKYRWQLAVYKLLVSARVEYAGWSVAGRLEFMTPEADGSVAVLPVELDEAVLTRVRELLAAVWRRVRALDFPETSGYAKSAAGMRQFEEFLLGEG